MEDDFLIVPSGSPDSYCRLCLSETNVEALLVADGFPQPNQKLVDLIRRHVAIGLTAPVDSPCGICSTCRMMLEEFERFRERCLRCDYVLTGIDRTHGQALPFECSMCPSKFRFKSEFEKHWKSFHDLFYRCDVCDAAFSTESLLNGHSKFHEGTGGGGEQNGEVETHQCTYCPRIFANDRQLRFHVQVLHEPKSSGEYVPPVPPARKKRKQDKRQVPEPEAPPPTMLSISIGESQPGSNGNGSSSYKPYECRTCGVRFHFIGSLTRHINDMHVPSSPNKRNQRRKKSKPAVPAAAAAAPVRVPEPTVVVDQPYSEPMMVEIPDLGIPASNPGISFPDHGIPISDPMVPLIADPAISTTGDPEVVVPELYGQYPGLNDSEYIPELIPTSKVEHQDYAAYSEEPPQEPIPVVYPCFIMMERLDPNLFPPIPNSEVPLGKYYHALQMQYATPEDPIDDEFKKNYPSYVRNIGSKKYPCDICSEQLSTRLSLYRHKQYKHSGQTFECPYCGKTFPNKAGVDRHIPLHTNEYPHVCDQCPLGFTRIGLLNKHKEKYHAPGAPPQKLHYCPYCSRAFNKLHQIRNHVALQHQDQYLAEGY